MTTWFRRSFCSTKFSPRRLVTCSTLSTMLWTSDTFLCTAGNTLGLLSPTALCKGKAFPLQAWTADPSGRAVSGVGLQPLACWDCGFESRRGHGCLSVVSVVCLSGRGLCCGLIPRPESYRLCCVIVCDLETSRLRRLKTRKWVVNASRKK